MKSVVQATLISIFTLACICLSSNLSAQIRPLPNKTVVQKDTSGNKIIIDHFGKLVEDREGFESVKWISQGLQLRIDSTNIYADSAAIFAEDRVFAYDHVVIQQGDSLHVFTDTLFYFRQTDIANLMGEVVLEQGTRQLWTKNLTYNLGARRGEYNQGGVLVDKDLQVSSKKGIYHAGQEEVLFKDSVIVLHPKFNLAADSMKYLAGMKKVVFTGPTNIFTKSAKIYCEGGFYDLNTETAEFNQKAQYAGQGKTGTADTIRYFSKEGEVRMLGNVIIEEEQRRITGQTLRYLENTGETWITGNPAVYKDANRSIVAPEIFYNETTDKIKITGASELQDGSQIIKFSEALNTDEATGTREIIGDVVVWDTLQKTGIMTDYLISKENEFDLAYKKMKRPVFFSIVDNDTLYISADTLRRWEFTDSLRLDSTVQPMKYNMMHAYYDVRLYKSNMQGLADSLTFHGGDSLFQFYGTPVLWADTSQFSADTIYMTLRNKTIDDITLQRRALIISEILDTYYDQIKGRTIVAAFDSSAIKEMTVTGNAESIYYTRDEQSAFIGVNKTVCSKMFFTFDAGQIDVLKYFGENHSNLLPMHSAPHDTLRLEGFNWREKERPKSLTDLLK